MHQQLQLLFFIFVTAFFASTSYAQSSSKSDNPTLDKIITPDIERRTITEDQIDS